MLIAFKLAEINLLMIDFNNLKKENQQLMITQQEYEQKLSDLKDIFTLESQILNILGTFYENDSNKVNSILDKYRFEHSPIEKNKVNYDGMYHFGSTGSIKSREKIPNILPVVGTISKKFSEEENHKGIDFAAPSGTPVFAAASGKVVLADKKDELGLTVVIDHEDGYETRYSHLKTISAKKGRQIKKGEILGFVGSTGKSSGPHLHYEVLFNGKSINPETLFND
ncbi:MAG: peptidoglycan DD-metalloendopeptidase family protein [Fibrobacter sp.]|nr:peptidoglycan DD-metalloendopeptidase family protein [Fibrobacter sp.]